MLAHLYAVAAVGDLGGREEEVRACVEHRAAELRARTASYLAADADGRARR
ncbi:hypothetical protein [Kitasatospora sp. CB01950]|uniref:hypothetical protein n=1 Tax=Kitasatospora sp. CB01950 TaxID=1703930 RepID=UPI00130120F3|nr:hypothetical protein [Kitasatospora sp. CB01950]